MPLPDHDQKTCRPLDDVSKVLPILNKISILGGLSETQLRAVFGLMQSVSYGAGETIFQQGDSPSRIYVIVCGRVKIVASLDDTNMELVEYREGQCFGETSAIGIEPHSASAIAQEDTELLVLTTQALHSLFRTDPPLFGLLILNIAREACRRLTKTDQIFLHYAAAKKHS